MMRHTAVLLAGVAAALAMIPDRADAGRCPVVVDRTYSYAMGIAVVATNDGSTGAYAYSGTGEVLKAIDVSDPTKPKIVGRLVVSGDINSLVADGDHAYLWAGKDRLHVIDIGDRRRPRAAGTLVVEDFVPDFDFGPFGEMVISDGVLFAVGSFGSPILAVDVHDPGAPAEIARHDGTFHHLAVSGARLYAFAAGSASEGWRVDIFDVADPARAVKLGSYQAAETSWGIAIAAEGAIVIVETAESLVVLDASDPSSPVELGTLDLQLYGWRSIVHSDGLVYAHGSTDLVVIDVHEPSEPIRIGHCNTPYTYGQPEDMVLFRGHAYLSHAYQGLVILDVNDPCAPRQVGQLVEGAPSDLAVQGRYAYRLQHQHLFPAHFERFWVADVGAADGPVDLGFLETDRWTHRLAVSGTHAYIIGREGFLLVVDLSDPAAPREVATLMTAAYGADIATNGSNAYLLIEDIGEQCHGLQIVDVSDPTRPTAFAEWSGHTLCGFADPKAIAISGSHVLIGAASWLLVVDVSDPSQPYEVARVATPAEAIAIRGPLAFIAAAESGLRIFDISEPSTPEPVGLVTLDGIDDLVYGPETATSLAVKGRHVLVGTSHRMLIVDISDLSEPSILREYRKKGPSDAIVVAGSHALLAQSWLGLVTLDLSGCPVEGDHSRGTASARGLP